MKLSSLFRMDGWQKLLTGYGSLKDKSTPQGAIPGFDRLLPVNLQALYYSDGRIKNAVNVPAESMVQEGFEVTGDDGTLYTAFHDLNGPEVIKQALVWTRMLGGALVVLDVEGAGKWDEPWYPEKGGRIRSMRVYPQTRVELGMMVKTEIPESTYFEDYERFTLRTSSGKFFEVHASRCLVFKSTMRVDADFPGWLEYERYWGLSAIYEGLEDARNFSLSAQATSHLMQECSIGKYKLSNLEQLVAESDYKAIETRLEAMDLQKSVINGVFLGEGEDYSRESVSFSGVPEIWDRQMMAVAGSYRIPVTRLFGRSAAGMNSTGESDEDNYNDYISGLQKAQLLAPLKKLMTCLNYETKTITGESGKPAKIAIEFNALSKRDQLKDAQIRVAMSQADRNYVEGGILPPDEIIRNRFQGGYSIDTSVSDDFVPDLSLEPEV